MKSILQITTIGANRQKFIQIISSNFLLKTQTLFQNKSRSLVSTTSKQTIKLRTADEILSASPIQLTPERIAKLKEDLTKLLKEKDFQQAEKTFFSEGLNRKTPTDLDLLRLGIKIFADQPKKWKVDEIVERARSEGVKFDSKIYTLLIQLYGGFGEYDQIEAALQEMKKFNIPRTKYIYTSMIDVYGGIKKDFPRILEIYSEMLKEGIDPDFKALLKIAVFSRNKLQMQQANELLNQAKENKWLKDSDFKRIQGKLIKKGLRSPLPKFIPYVPITPDPIPEKKQDSVKEAKSEKVEEKKTK